MAHEERASQFFEVKEAVKRFETASDWDEKERILSRIKSRLLKFMWVFVGVARSIRQRADMQRVMDPTQAIIDVSPTVWLMLKTLKTRAVDKREQRELRNLLDELDRLRRPSLVETAKSQAEQKQDGDVS